MAAPSGRISTSPSKQVLNDVRKHIQSGDAEKLFGDENFVLDLIKLLYEDTIDKGLRTELVLSLEEYGCLSLNTNSVEQMISSLVDIFNQNVNKEGRCNFCLQLIISFTTITIYHQQVRTSLGGNVISRLWNVIKNTNHVPSRRIRGCCCQSLIQLENSAPGVLQKYKDELLSLVKQEKTHVGQDYMQLLSTVLQAALSKDDNGTKTEEEKDKVVVERSLSVISSQELLPDISYIMENVALVTAAGLWSIIKSLTNILQSSTDISPSIFKPLILHHMATLDPMVFHLILYLQKEFEGEVLTSPEEQQLLLRLVTCVNHPLLSPAHRLLFVQWLKGYANYGSEVKDTRLPEFVCHNYQDTFYPCDFDSLDLHLGKLSLLCSSKRQDQGEDFDAKLLRCTNYLQHLSQKTGGFKTTLALYRSLYKYYKHHSTSQLIHHIQSITHNLLGNYPALIPLVLNFLHSVRDCSPHSNVYMDILSTLHKSVLSISYEDVLNQYGFYLQVFQTSAKEPELNQQSSVVYLQGLVKCSLYNDLCEWYFGNAVLTVCRNILSHQDTETLFTELGELLYEMSIVCDDTDIQDRARFYYALLTNAADNKINSVLQESVPDGKFTGQNFSSLLPGSMNEKKASINYLTQPIFSWERLRIKPVFTTEDEQVSVTDNIEDYLSILKKITIQLEATYKLTVVKESEFNDIYGISVKLDDNNNYKHVKDCHVISMTKSDSTEVTLTFEPLEPKPATFSTSVLLTADGETYSSSLPSTDINFTDLLLQFPWQLFNIQSESRYEFWCKLWSKFTDDSDDASGVESHKITSCSLNRIQMLWESFRVDEDRKETSSRYLMILPPSFHILFQVKTRKQNLVISIATDHWPLLPLINNYLNTLNS